LLILKLMEARGKLGSLTTVDEVKIKVMWNDNDNDNDNELEAESRWDCCSPGCDVSRKNKRLREEEDSSRNVSKWSRNEVISISSTEQQKADTTLVVMNGLVERLGHRHRAKFVMLVGEMVMSAAMMSIRKIGNSLEIFYGSSLPTVELGFYLGRLVYFIDMNYSDDESKHDALDSVGIRCLVLAVMYVDRLHKKKLVVLDPENVHRLFAAAFIIAIKYLEDAQLSQMDLAKICGLQIKNLNAVVIQFCLLSGFKFGFIAEEFDSIFCKIRAKAIVER